MFSDLCTVSDEAFGKFTIERCWDIWLKECEEELNKNDFSDNSSDTNKEKIKYQYAVKKTNKRFGGWTSDGMKRYDEIASVVKKDRNLNQKIENDYKDFMYEKMYGNKEEKQNAVPDVILSDIQDKLGEEYEPYNDFESPYITNEEEFTSTSANNKGMHITPEKVKIVTNTILSNDFYLTQQEHQCDGNMQIYRSNSQQSYQHDGSNGNTPSDPSDHETDDENFDDEIQVSYYRR